MRPTKPGLSAMLAWVLLCACLAPCSRAERVTDSVTGGETAVSEDETGEEGGDDYRLLFDGKTLSGWEGDAPYWSVRDGAIVGEITSETLIDRNRFLIYQGDLPADFELQLEYRISEQGNSGINYRSERVEGVDFHALAGYQCDLDGQLNYAGSNYEERRRTTLASVGQSVIIPAVDDGSGHVESNAWSNRVIEPLGEPQQLRAHIRRGDWNKVRIVANGNRLEHHLNDTLMSRVIDEDPVGRRFDGELGIQVHVGPPMTVEFRNLRVRSLSAQE